ncbi:hypothetical protein JG068_014 [Burkholderia phage JG068]|uniref:Uncharacterized protein n=1 Tax=Burkholderia phage JG068 TaxID=1401297 RepID=U3PDJ2_9CAUD|nr:hypothetical protein JG068_014 [Burkholderia phage JG068]AGW43596.1 hypothetical protein JG068_014 [Burkholderia phage JG068]
MYEFVKTVYVAGVAPERDYRTEFQIGRTKCGRGRRVLWIEQADHSGSSDDGLDTVILDAESIPALEEAIRKFKEGA